MVFSWAQTLDRAYQLKLKHAKQLAINQDSQYKIKHPDESRDATQKNFTKLTLRIKKEHEDRIHLTTERRRRMYGKN